MRMPDHSSFCFRRANLLVATPEADATDGGEGKENARFDVSQFGSIECSRSVAYHNAMLRPQMDFISKHVLLLIPIQEE